MSTFTALAHPNIAFIKYWGNRDNALRLPSNGSISMNLDGLYTRTRVEFDGRLDADHLEVNDQTVTGPGYTRVVRLLDEVRRRSAVTASARVESRNNFPMGAGIASSASAFAALALAASAAAGLNLPESELDVGMVQPPTRPGDEEGRFGVCGGDADALFGVALEHG